MIVIEIVDAILEDGEVQVFFMVDMHLDVMMDIIVNVVHLVDMKVIILKREIHHQLVYELILVFMTRQSQMLIMMMIYLSLN